MSNGSISNGVIHPGKEGASTKIDNAMSGDATTASTAVLKPSIPMPSRSTKIRGIDFNEYERPITVQQLTSHFLQTGFQATNLGRAIEIINNMVLQTQKGADLATMETRRYSLRFRRWRKSSSPAKCKMHNLPRIHIKLNLLRLKRNTALSSSTSTCKLCSNYSRRNWGRFN